jgi:hypothetical protein
MINCPGFWLPPYASVSFDSADVISNPQTSQAIQELLLRTPQLAQMAIELFAPLPDSDPRRSRSCSVSFTGNMMKLPSILLVAKVGLSLLTRSSRSREY